MNSPFPTPNTNALQLSHQLTDLIRTEIKKNSGYISFARYMEMALYTPELGYYMNPFPKFGKEGDFTTAPEVSELFAQCLARQIQQVFQTLKTGDILEFGAGNGHLCVDLLAALANLDSLPAHYYMIEISPALKQQQQQLIAQQSPDLAKHVVWVDQVPAHFTGVIIANEVLDAMPIHRFHLQQQNLKACSVTWEDNQFVDCLTPPDENLTQAVHSLGIDLQADYTSEINLSLHSFIHSLAEAMQQGLVLIIDYGYPRHEYYHPQRWMGTLMCHYQHHAHTNPYWHPGLQDITAFVDYTAILDAAHATPFIINGYTTQSHFLLSCGMLELIDKIWVDNIKNPWAINQQIKQLLLPSQMGESFKVLGLTKDFNFPLLGFTLHNMQEKL